MATKLSPAAKVVYRSLLKWCQKPIVTRVPFTLPVLSSNLDHFWSSCNTSGHAITNAEGSKEFIRTIFRSEQKHESLDLGFEALRELNKFTTFLVNMEAQRKMREDLTGIQYSVGQVLCHKKFGFRAVVYGWDRRPTVDVSEWEGVKGLEREAQQPFYHMLPDQGDCERLLGGPRDMRYVAEDNLEPVEDFERRIHHPLIPHAFEHFESSLGIFVPDQMLIYQYPNPLYTDVPSSPSPEAQQALQQLEAMVHEVTSRLNTSVTGANLWHRVDQLFGDQFKAKLQTWPGPPSARIEERDTVHSISRDTVHSMLRDLRSVQNVATLLSQQRDAHSDRASVAFGLGQVLRHKKYDFRGAVAGWDSRPVVDVAHWDGVEDLALGAEQPFYHILPDHHDCVLAFGAPRDSRYVAQENLEVVPANERLISSERLNQILPQYCDETGQFYVSEELLFQYPSDEALVVSATGREASDRELESLLTMTQSHLFTGISDAQEKLMPALFTLLCEAAHSSDAEVIEDTIWACWRYHPDPSLGAELNRGMRLMETAQHTEALEVFSGLVAKEPTWTEARNKRATAAFFAGEYEDSLADIALVLEAEPLHFGALAGQGLIKLQQKEYEAAVDIFSKALEVNPWMANIVSHMRHAQQQLSQGTVEQSDAGTQPDVTPGSDTP